MGEKFSEITNQSSYNSTPFEWLQGSWKRAIEQEDRQTFEKWEKKSDNEFQGFGFTLKNSDTIWKEQIKLINRGRGWSFEVSGPEENQPTIFKLTHIENERFESENLENDFPKVIIYYKEGLNLKAIISGGGTEIPFDFEPIN